jgi:hypothetical protein
VIIGVALTVRGIGGDGATTPFKRTGKKVVPYSEITVP